MNAYAFNPIYRSSASMLLAVGVHLGLALGLLTMARMEITPPLAVGGFEVVDLSAFGAAVPQEPEPTKEEPVEEKVVEPEPEPLLEPEPEIVEKVAPIPVPKPKPIEKPKPKVKPIAKPKPKVLPIRLPKKTVTAKPKPKSQPSSVGSQNAFVPPKSDAAYLRNPKPRYPSIAKRRGMQGIVLLYVEVSAQGRPTSVRVKKSSGFVLLDKAALKAVRAWRFAPAKRAGRPVDAGVEIPIRFILSNA